MARKQSINSLRNLLQYRSQFKKFTPEMTEDEIIYGLAEEGQRIIRLAYVSRGFTNRSYNLHDSYVSAVFRNGVWLKDTTRYVGPEMSKFAVEFGDTASGEPEMADGREEAKKFLSKLQFSKGRPSSISLVVAAAMFYSGIVEARGYSVLANVEMDMQDLKSKGFNGKKYLANIKLSEITESSIYREDGKGRMQIINK